MDCEMFTFAGELMRPGLNQLCNNVMGYLNTQGFYPALQVSGGHCILRSLHSNQIKCIHTPHISNLFRGV